VRVASWDDLAPVVGDDPALIRAVAQRNPNVFDEIPVSALIRAVQREPTSAWLAMVRDRLAKLDAPDPELAALLHDFRELCADRIVGITKAIADARRRGEDDSEREVALFEDQRIVLESALDHASRLLVH
jgi:hypothetical protein